MLLLLLYSISSIILSIFFFIFLKGNLVNLFRKPICLTLLFLTVIHGITPAVQYPQGVLRYLSAGQTYTFWSHLYSLFMVLFFTIIMVIFYCMRDKKTSDVPVPQLSPISLGGKAYLFIFMVLPATYGVLSYSLTILRIGYAAYMSDRVGFADRYGGMSLLFSQWMYVSFLVSFAAYLISCKRDKAMLVLAIILAVVSIGYSVLLEIGTRFL